MLQDLTSGTTTSNSTFLGLGYNPIPRGGEETPMSQMFNPLCTRFSMQSQLHPPRTLTTSDTLEWGGSPLQRMCNPLCIRLPMLLQQRRAPWNPKGWHGLPSLTIVFGHRRTRELLVTTPTQVQNATSVTEVKQGAAYQGLPLRSPSVSLRC